MQVYHFNVGDLVQLKSGSPRMVVAAVRSAPAVWEFGMEVTPATYQCNVVYIVYGTGEVKEAMFDRRLLVPASDRRDY